MEIRIKKLSWAEIPRIELPQEPIRIGSLCSECTDPEKKVMQSYVFNLDNIVNLGMYEKAQIATQVLLEQGGDPIEIAENRLTPLAEAVVDEYEAGKINKIQLIKSLQAADVAFDVLAKEAGSGWRESRAVGWKEFLRKTVLKYCGFVLP